MSDTSLAESAAEHTHKKRLTIFLRWWKSPRLTASSVAVAIALIAVAVAIAAWLRPAHEGTSPSFSSQQSAQAKKNVCSAYATVRKAVFERSVNPRPDDPVAKLEVGTNRGPSRLGEGRQFRGQYARAPCPQQPRPGS